MGLFYQLYEGLWSVVPDGRAWVGITAPSARPCSFCSLDFMTMYLLMDSWCGAFREEAPGPPCLFVFVLFCFLFVSLEQLYGLSVFRMEIRSVGVWLCTSVPSYTFLCCYLSLYVLFIKWKFNKDIGAGGGTFKKTRRPWEPTATRQCLLACYCVSYQSQSWRCERLIRLLITWSPMLSQQHLGVFEWKFFFLDPLSALNKLP